MPKKQQITDYSKLIDLAKKYGNLDREKWNKNKIKGKKKKPKKGGGYRYEIPASALNSGQLSYLNKFNKHFRETAKARIIKPRRKPGESNAAYNRRLKEIKNNVGQSDTPVRFPQLYMPENASYELTKDNKLIIERDSSFGRFKEEIFPLDGVEFINQYDGDFLGFLIDFVEQHDLYNKLDNYRDIVLSLQCGNALMNYGASITRLEGLADEIDRMINSYVQNLIDDGEEEEAEEMMRILFTAITVRYYPMGN